VIVPLYKNKGDSSDLNNFRGISILPPIAKIFERVLAAQIGYYFESNNLFFNGQHGFRRGHSCETALHEIANDCFGNLGRNFVTILLFVDFKKAFDLVDQELLLYKLGNYGLNLTAINLLRSYFKERSVAVKIGNTVSKTKELTLGVPQGSVLGPLLFLIFINDLPYAIISLIVKMFADDTTIYASGTTIDDATDIFNLHVLKFIAWCEFNRMDINWSKTKVMFISRKVLPKAPKFISINNCQVEVVSTFKLLGVQLDSTLKFKAFIANICANVNKRLFALKRLFFLSHNIKIQFFKTFLLPYFDYCTTLTIYIDKTISKKLFKCYYASLFRLFKYNFVNSDLVFVNSRLKKFGLAPIQYRLVSRLFVLVCKIRNSKACPSNLKYLSNISEKTTCYNLRTPCTLDETINPNHYFDNQFKCLVRKLLNILTSEKLDMEFDLVKSFLFKNLEFIFVKFIKKFKQFDIADCYLYFYH
jgi:hypothetical protein